MTDPLILDSTEAKALEDRIRSRMQEMTPEETGFYFKSSAVGIQFSGATAMATASEIRKLAHKYRDAVKGLDPWEDKTYPQEERLQIPESQTCEFCGKSLEYIGALKPGRGYDWELVRWSQVPQPCQCEASIRKRQAEEEERRRQEEEEARRIEEENRRIRIQENLRNSGMKKRFLARRFENFKTDTKERRQAYRTAKEYADHFQAHAENGDGLYIEGTFGTGKTHLAAAIAIQLMEGGHSVIFKTSDDLLWTLKDSFQTGQERQAMDRIRQCELLVIDDLGKEQATDWSTSQLYAIINDRYETMKPVIITTNFNEDDLIAMEAPKGVGTHRIRAILSRLHETCILLTMDWQDWRGNV